MFNLEFGVYTKYVTHSPALLYSMCFSLINAFSGSKLLRKVPLLLVVKLSKPTTEFERISRNRIP